MRLIRQSRFSFAAVTAVLAGAVGTRAQAQSWDLTSGFSCASNPNGPWSFGASDALVGGTFVTLPFSTSQGGTYPGCGWQPDAATSYPDVEFTTNTPIGAPGGPTLANGANAIAMIRWTAPAAGVYTVSSTFESFWARWQAYFGTGQAHLVIAGVDYDAGQFEGWGEQRALRTITGLSLAQGDTIDACYSAGGRPLVHMVISTCPADFNADGFIDIFDFTDFVTCFEGDACPPGKTADFNNDGFPDIFDFTDFIDAFEAGC